MSGYGKLSKYETPIVFMATCEACGLDEVRCFQVTDWAGKERDICFICLAGYHAQYRAEQKE